MTNNPFDPAEFMKIFDPEAMRKMFDPQNMLAAFQQSAGKSDVSGMTEKNKKQLEEMAQANKAAAESFQDMMAKQMAIFQEVIAPAQKLMAEPGDPENLNAQTEAVSKAMSDGFALMKTMADNTRKSNEEAMAKFKTQMEQAMKGAAKA